MGLIKERANNGDFRQSLCILKAGYLSELNQLSKTICVPMGPLPMHLFHAVNITIGFLCQNGLST
jgi:hypothetical protein